METYVGEIRLFAGDFAPIGWALCDGSLLSVSAYPDLFRVINKTYGGDGQTTFALPDLRGRVPVGPGEGPGLSERSMGQGGGTETETLTLEQIPAHQHHLTGSNEAGISQTPENGYFGLTGEDIYTSASQEADVNMGPTAPTGDGAAHPNVQPFLALNYIIATAGVIPTQQ